MASFPLLSLATHTLSLSRNADQGLLWLSLPLRRRRSCSVKGKKRRMVSPVSRQGRQLQRYKDGRRLVVGCIPYKFNIDKPCSDELDDQRIEVLLISSQKGCAMMFPKDDHYDLLSMFFVRSFMSENIELQTLLKGGWESDETIEQAAKREALEEAGVQGNVERKLGTWKYKSKRYGTFYNGIMFPLNVTEQLVSWPEMGVRQRKWVSIKEAKEVCEHVWMREALERLVRRLQQREPALL